MTLLSLLLALAIERSAAVTQYMHWHFYAEKYFSWLRSRHWLSEKPDSLKLTAVCLVPALVAFLLLNWLGSAFISFAVQTVILLICIGCVHLRDSYKGYLRASGRGDCEAAYLYAGQLGYESETEYSFGQQLIWVNYRHYTAVILWFVVLGAPGAIFYVLARELDKSSQPSENKTGLMHWLDWLPVRVSSLGLLLMGHFSNALPVWIEKSSQAGIKAECLLKSVSKAAETVEPDVIECTTEPCTMVTLAKRNTMLILAVSAILTLGGVLN